MKHSEENIVIKYFDLVDEFIKVKCCSEEVLLELLDHEIHNKASYRGKIVETCVPDFRTEILPAVTRLDEDYDTDVVEELLYQICIDVNPSLEIHQVSLPTKTTDSDGLEATLIPRAGLGQRNDVYRKVLGLEKAIKNQVLGQEAAIQSLTRAVKKAAVGLKRPGTPIGTFLLVGRTGTGKTELAKVMSRELYDEPGRLVRVDCSEYALPHEYAKLIGSPPGYIGHSEGGFLTEAVKKKRNCIVLFDEIEKAHSKVHNLLLQLLDEGILTDSKGQVIPFDQTIIILTSNLGIEKIDSIRSRMGFRDHGAAPFAGIDLEQTTIEAMKDHFRPEFINRIDEVIVFNPLDVKVCTRIAHRMLREVKDLLAMNGMRVDFSPAIKGLLARQGFSEEYGARELKRLIKRKIEDPLTDLILTERLTNGAHLKVKVQSGAPVIELVGTSTETLETV